MSQQDLDLEFSQGLSGAVAGSANPNFANLDSITAQGTPAPKDQDASLAQS